MEKLRILPAMVFQVILLAAPSFSERQDIIAGYKLVQDTVRSYNDGSFEGRSRSSYTDEPYWGIVKVTIKNGSIAEISFTIRDSSLHETFNENYEKHFQSNPVYIQQSRNNWGGVQIYPKKLSETQDTGKVDAISGATWSYNIFKASLKEALKNVNSTADSLTSR
jgi:major membrane immunogen (membrane-anchored lipoprotein)